MSNNKPKQTPHEITPIHAGTLISGIPQLLEEHLGSGSITSNSPDECTIVLLNHDQTKQISLEFSVKPSTRHESGPVVFGVTN